MYWLSSNLNESTLMLSARLHVTALHVAFKFSSMTSGKSTAVVHPNDPVLENSEVF